MGYESARLPINCDVADSMGSFQVWPSDKAEEQLGYNQGIVGGWPRYSFRRKWVHQKYRGRRELWRISSIPKGNGD